MSVIHRLYLIQSSTCCSILKLAALEIHAARSISSLSGVGSCTLLRCTRTKERYSGVDGYMRGITYAVACVGDFPYAVCMSWQTAIRAVSQLCERIVSYSRDYAIFKNVTTTDRRYCILARIAKIDSCHYIGCNAGTMSTTTNTMAKFQSSYPIRKQASYAADFRNK